MSEEDCANESGLIVEEATLKFKSKINDFWQKKYRKDLGKNWNLFYKRNETRFFRDRHWIPREFPELLAGPLRLFEVGCGVGNFTFPLKKFEPPVGGDWL